MKDEAWGILDQLEELSQNSYVDPFYLALVHTALGEHDRAIELLRECVEIGSTSTVFLPSIRWLDPLRSDARFKELLELAFVDSR
jgi:hypothetical protein